MKEIGNTINDTVEALNVSAMAMSTMVCINKVK